MSLGIDLSLLPTPAVIDTLNYETILAQMLADFKTRMPQFTALLESDPIYKVLEVAAYRELLLRQNHNEKASQIMLAYAKGSNLDALGALPWLQITRLIIVPADNSTVPPTAAVLEDDTAFRKRLLLAYNQLSTAGSTNSYEFHALSASGTIKSASVTSPLPGDVLVTILSSNGDGTASATEINTVNTALNAETIRPLTDHVTVQSAVIIPYTITATLTFFTGVSSTLVLTAVNQSIADYVRRQHQIGLDITTSGVMSALHLQGVQNVALTGFSDIPVNPLSAAYNTNITIIDGGISA